MAAAYPKVGTRGTGRRKEAIVRVRLVPGNGQVIINGKSMEQYLGNRKALHIPVKQPLVAAGVEDRYNVLVNATGGGVVGQSIAIRMGVARALKAINKEHEIVMRKEGFLTRDARVKERKKYGLKKARKASQFSKR
ncbi:30S ribosomal protein S9 [Vampirovibrio chlorellavorus]|uniref:30S ribosomal protein S9 n=1 Tax=Vampirovibrio chlorellavorus TaxID=758823 RepID=UPI0026EABCEA|nr:30S ribosomal protein S9 [Vampirovibrio chlorellavorus]